MAYVKKGHHRRRVLCPCHRRDMDYTATRCCLCASDERRAYWQRRHAIAKGWLSDEAPDLRPAAIDVLYTAAQVRATWGSWRRVLREEAA